MDLVEVPAGQFWMGWEHGVPSERPRHQVWVDSFAIGRAPVTTHEYAGYLDATRALPPPWWNDPRFDDPGQPVVGVDFADALGFCEWLSAVAGTLHRLPTEAEWEKAARGGLEDARFPWGDTPPAALGLPPGFDRPPPVASTPPNPFGLVALAGVCHEWCLDWESARYYAESPPSNPRGPATGTRRASRGGAWRHQDPWSPVAHRSSLPPHLKYSDYGFRVVRSRLDLTLSPGHV